MDSFFAVTAPGLEGLTTLELLRLDLLPAQETVAAKPVSTLPRPDSGGVLFKGDLDALYRANLYLRTASRVLARVGTFFYATTFVDLREKASRLPWDRFIRPGQPVDIRVTCHKSKLYHSDGVAERIAGAIYDRLGHESKIQKEVDEEADNSPQLVVVRLYKDQVTVSMDSSGDLLHRRGYRQAVAKAPLRETLAAAMLMASGWDKKSPLIDPFCGSGTIPIEAALMALNIPPGMNRHFAFMDWPSYDESRWNAIKAEVESQPVTELPIYASDRDAGAVEMARENAERAGVAEAIQFDCQAVSAIHPPEQKFGWVVTNPPYGLRVSEGKDLRNLYAQFGNVLRARCLGWNVAVLSSDLALLGQMGLKLDTFFSMSNGGVSVRLGRGIVKEQGDNQ
jgi:putative N6-adenine-specific DNA methylase